MVFFHRGGQIRSRHRYGGAKILTFQQNHNTSIALSVPEWGPNSIANFDGGPWPDLPPWIRHCVYYMSIELWTSTRGRGPAHVDACGQGDGGQKPHFCGRHKWMAPKPGARHQLIHERW